MESFSNGMSNTNTIVDPTKNISENSSSLDMRALEILNEICLMIPLVPSCPAATNESASNAKVQQYIQVLQKFHLHADAEVLENISIQYPNNSECCGSPQIRTVRERNNFEAPSLSQSCSCMDDNLDENRIDESTKLFHSKRSKLSASASLILNTWLRENWDSPYPSVEQKLQLAEKCNISERQAILYHDFIIKI